MKFFRADRIIKFQYPRNTAGYSARIMRLALRGLFIAYVRHKVAGLGLSFRACLVLVYEVWGEGWHLVLRFRVDFRA